MDEGLFELVEYLVCSLQDMYDEMDTLCDTEEMANKLEPLADSIEYVIDTAQEVMEYIFGEEGVE